MWKRDVQREGAHVLAREWLHPEGSEVPTHSLSVGHTKPTRGQEAMSVTLGLREPSGVRSLRTLAKRANGKWHLGTGVLNEFPEARVPSESLQSMIRNYHKQDAGSAAWAPLLDALAEEYPDHFGHHVDQHTAARAT